MDAITFHLAKLTSGAPDANWITSDYTTCEGKIDTWWTSFKPSVVSAIKLAQIVWYKDGPVWSPTDRANGPANPAERITARSVVGTDTNAALPPQVAATVTKVCDIRKRWGRVYLPAGSFARLGTDGRIAAVSTYLTPLVTMFNALRLAGFQPVVFSRGRSAYTGRRGTAIAAHVATAYEITALACDDSFDVMRSRRYSVPTVRTQTTLT